MMRRQNDARRCFGLTGQVTPIPSPALVDLVGPRSGRASGVSQHTSSLSRAGSCMPPVGPRMAPREDVTVHPA